MARMVKGLMATALMAALVVPQVYAVNYYVKTPPSGFDKDVFNASQLQGMNLLNSLSTMQGMNLGNLANMDMSKVLMASVAQDLLSGNPLNSELLGKIAGIAAMKVMDQAGLGNLSPIVGGAIAGNFGGVTGGLTSASGFGGFGGLTGTGINGLSGLSGLAGGLDANSIAAIGLGLAMQQMTSGGIQGSDDKDEEMEASLNADPYASSSSSLSSSSSTSSAGASSPSAGSGYTSSDMPTLSKTATVATTTINYSSGMYDALMGNQPDSRFQFTDDNSYDTNYWAGYQAGLKSRT